jgi:hypothetical protein
VIRLPRPLAIPRIGQLDTTALDDDQLTVVLPERHHCRPAGVRLEAESDIHLVIELTICRDLSIDLMINR